MKTNTAYQRIIFLIIFICFAGNSFLFGKELSFNTFYLTPKSKKEKKEPKEKKITTSTKGASALNNFVIQPTINLGYHSGFSKMYSGFGYGYAYRGLIPGLTLNLDYNPHQYASFGAYYGIAFQKFTQSNVLYMNHAFGARVAFHWWQLMADKSDKELMADKIDFDIHVHIGGYKAIERNNNTNVKLKHLGFNAGGGIGFRYYFVKHFGVALEAGYEELSYMKLGIAVKF